MHESHENEGSSTSPPEGMQTGSLRLSGMGQEETAKLEKEITPALGLVFGLQVGGLGSPEVAQTGATPRLRVTALDPSYSTLHPQQSSSGGTNSSGGDFSPVSASFLADKHKNSNLKNTGYNSNIYKQPHIAKSEEKVQDTQVNNRPMKASREASGGRVFLQGDARSDSGTNSILAQY